MATKNFERLLVQSCGETLEDMLIDVVGVRGNLGKSLINSLERAAILELDNVLISNKAVLAGGNEERSRRCSLLGGWGGQHHGKDRKKDGQPHFEGWGLSSCSKSMACEKAFGDQI